MRAYADYKESGVPQIGQIPSHWKTGGLKNIFRIVGGSTPQSGEATYWDGEITWVTPADLSKLTGRGISQSLRTITEPGLSACGSSLVPEGSLILSTRAPIGSLAVAERELCTNQGCKALVPAATLEPTFFYFVLSVSTEALNVRGRGTTFLEISGDALGSFPVPVPPLPEQQAIAAFLDRETGKIDALVEEQRRLIALLKEKRQAVISHAVTKGLDPAAPLKPSGIDWLGDIPAHWSVPKKLSHLASKDQHSFVNGPFGSDLLASELTLKGVPVVYIRDLGERGYSRKSEWHVSETKARRLNFCHVTSGDLLVAKVGDPPGHAVIYPNGEPDAIVTQDVIRLRPNSEVASTSFLTWLLNSHFGQIQIDQIAVVSTRTRVGLGDYKQLRVSLPPIDEQDAISAFLDAECEKMDTLTAEASRAIDLLQERRAALISAAVTGKIDVRDESRNTTQEEAA